MLVFAMLATLMIAAPAGLFGAKNDDGGGAVTPTATIAATTPAAGG